MKRTLLFLFLAVCVVCCRASQAAAQTDAQGEAQKPPQSPPAAAPNAIASPSGTEIGNGIFEQKCVSCHEHPATGSRAPSFATMKLMTPEKIYSALITGPMAVVVGNTLTDMEKRRVAETVSGRLIGSTGAGDAKSMPNHCASNPPMADPACRSGVEWLGCRCRKHEISIREGRGNLRGSSAALEIEMGFRFSHGPFGLRPADHRVRPRLRRQRQRVRLLA